ncbi:protein Fer3-like [Dendronephthya gigantea]|uniref:protein Fer3-like n=1 Tax=Dendronephthya gigantea TaxID=151771 RepID=UPI00106B34E2|nr:protein Fer3-like [Dendronephthya gigantea]
MSFPATPEHGKTVAEADNEVIGEDKKRKQRKKRILTGVSRQRRAANDRERRRNVRLNQAFVTLKKTLPLANIDISKIEILRLAVKWIDHLATLLKDHEQRKDLIPSDEMVIYDQIVEKSKPVRHDCLYHQDPDLKNTLWEDCIGLPKRTVDDNDGCIHIRTNSRFHELFS